MRRGIPPIVLKGIITYIFMGYQHNFFKKECNSAVSGLWPGVLGKRRPGGRGRWPTLMQDGGMSCGPMGEGGDALFGGFMAFRGALDAAMGAIGRPLPQVSTPHCAFFLTRHPLPPPSTFIYGSLKDKRQKQAVDAFAFSLFPFNMVQFWKNPPADSSV